MSEFDPTVERIKVGALVALLVGGVALANYAMSNAPGKTEPIAAAPAPTPNQRHQFDLNFYGDPTFVDCDSPETKSRQAVLHIAPSRSPDDLVVAARRGGKVIDAARIQVGPPDSDVSMHDWNGNGHPNGERIAIAEYQTPKGARRDLGTIASILVQADDQKVITITTACD